MDILSFTSRRILQLCEERHITPYALSCKAGIPFHEIESILNGQNQDPDIPTMKKICDGLGVSLTHFFAPMNIPDWKWSSQ